MSKRDRAVLPKGVDAFRSWKRPIHGLWLGLTLGLASVVLTQVSVAQTSPRNDNFGNAIPIVGTNITVVGTNDNATKEPGEPDHAGNAGGKSVWWIWQAPSTAFVSISTRGSRSSIDGWALDTVLAVYTGSAVNGLTEVASNDEDPATYFTSRVGFRAVAGTVYRIAVDGYSYGTAADADSGTIMLSLSVSGLAANDDFANAAVLSGTNVTITANNDAASKEPGEPNHAGDPGGKSLWWSWQAPASGFVWLSTLGSISSQTGSDLQALLGVYLGDSVSSLSLVDDSSGSPASVSFRADAGKTYRIAVDGSNWGTVGDADSGTIQLSLKFATGLPLAPTWGPIPDLYGNMVNSTDFGGKVVLLNFWATWCPPCVAEIPDLVAVYQKYAVDGLVVVGISVDNSPDGINAPTSLVGNFAFSNGMNYPVLTDQPFWWAVEGAFGSIPYIPTTFVVDRQNHICAKFVGSQSYATFESAVMPLLYANLSVNLAFVGGQAHLSWPVTQGIFVLENSSTMAPGSWTPVTASVQSDGINQFVDLPIGAGRQFFRLRDH